jgi:hypothetical protein
MAADGTLKTNATYSTTPVAYSPVPKHAYAQLIKDRQIGALTLLIGLINYLVFNFKSNEAAIPYRTLAQMAGCGMGSIRDRIAVLVKRGYLITRIQDGFTLYQVNDQIFYETPATPAAPAIVYQLTSISDGKQQRQVRHIKVAGEGVAVAERSNFDVGCSEIEHKRSEIEQPCSDSEQERSNSEHLFIIKEEKKEQEIKQEGSLPPHAHAHEGDSAKPAEIPTAAQPVDITVNADSSVTATLPDGKEIQGADINTLMTALDEIGDVLIPAESSAAFDTAVKLAANQPPQDDDDNPPTGGGQRNSGDDYYRAPKRGGRGEGAKVANRTAKRTGGQASADSSVINPANVSAASTASFDPSYEDDSLARQAAANNPALGDIGFETCGAFPANFRLTAALREIIKAHFGELQEAGLQNEIESFKDYYQARGETRADWIAAFKGWLRKAINGRFGSTLTAAGVETPRKQRASKATPAAAVATKHSPATASGSQKWRQITADQCRVQIAHFMKKEARNVGGHDDITAAQIARVVRSWFEVAGKSQFWSDEICQQEIDSYFDCPGFYLYSRDDEQPYNQADWEARQQDVSDGKRSAFEKSNEAIVRSHIELLAGCDLDSETIVTVIRQDYPQLDRGELLAIVRRERGEAAVPSEAATLPSGEPTTAVSIETEVANVANDVSQAAVAEELIPAVASVLPPVASNSLESTSAGEQSTPAAQDEFSLDPDIEASYSPNKSIAQITDDVIARIKARSPKATAAFADSIYPIIYKAILDIYPQNSPIDDLYEKPLDNSELDEAAHALAEIQCQKLVDKMPDHDVEQWQVLAEATLPSNEVGLCDATVYQEWLNEEAYRLIYVYCLRKARKSIIDQMPGSNNKQTAA